MDVRRLRLSSLPMSLSSALSLELILSNSVSSALFRVSLSLAIAARLRGAPILAGASARLWALKYSICLFWFRTLIPSFIISSCRRSIKSFLLCIFIASISVLVLGDMAASRSRRSAISAARMSAATSRMRVASSEGKGPGRSDKPPPFLILFGFFLIRLFLRLAVKLSCLSSYGYFCVK